MEERSAGAVVFNERGSRQYVLLLNAGKWDFPKGNMEKGEDELQTVLREVREETGLGGISIVPGFRKVIEYFYRRSGRNVHKRVIFLLARTAEDTVAISAEHQAFGWFTLGEALKKASYDNSRGTLREADTFLENLKSDGRGS